MNLDVVDAAELAELLQFLTGWITSDPARLAPSLLAFVGHPAYGLPQLRNDLDRFTFLLGGNDGEPLFQPGPLSALHPTIRPALPLQPVTRKPGRRPNTPRTNTSVHQSPGSRPQRNPGNTQDHDLRRCCKMRNHKQRYTALPTTQHHCA
jgi:hypothetical protein